MKNGKPIDSFDNADLRIKEIDIVKDQIKHNIDPGMIAKEVALEKERAFLIGMIYGMAMSKVDPIPDYYIDY